MGDLSRRLNSLAARAERRIGSVHGWALPAHVTIEPTNACNSRCIMCLPYRCDATVPSPPTGMMERATLERVDPVLRRARRVLLSGFGEALMHPDLVEMVRWAKARVPHAYMFTNGSLMTAETAAALVEAGIDQVCFSVGGATEAVQQRVRGVPLAPLREGIANLVDAARRAGRGPEIRFNIVAMNSVLDSFEQIVEMAVEFGVTAIDLPQMWVESIRAKDESPLLRDDAAERLRAAQRIGASKGVEVTTWDYPPSPAACTSPFDSMWVAWNGDVFSCQFERYVMGNVNDSGAVDLWRGRAFRELRRRVRTEPSAVCPNCPVVVGTIESLLDPPQHGRLVAPRFTGEGPERVVHERMSETDPTCGPG